MLSKPYELAALREEARHVNHTIATDESIPFIERARVIECNVHAMVEASRRIMR